MKTPSINLSATLGYTQERLKVQGQHADILKGNGLWANRFIGLKSQANEIIEDAMLNKICGTNMVRAYDNHRLPGRKNQPVIPLRGKDKVSLDKKPAEIVTYGIPQKSGVEDNGYLTLREMIVNILEGQGLTTRIAAGDMTVDLKEITPEQAQELIVITV